MSIVVQWVVAILAGAIFLFLVLVVPTLIFFECRRLVRRGEIRNISGVWVIGSVAGLVGLMAVPIGQFEYRIRWWWLPFAAEALMIVIMATAFRVTGLSREIKSLRERRDSKP